MGVIDIVLAIILLLGFYTGWKKGLFVALAGLIGLILGIIGAVYFSGFAADYLTNWFDWSEQLTNLVAFAVTFLGIVITISLLGKILTKVADFAALGIINKLAGAVFNLLKYALIVSVIFMFLNASEDLSGYIISEEKKEASILYPYVEPLAPLVIPHVLKEVDKYKDELPEKDNNEKEIPSEIE